MKIKSPYRIDPHTKVKLSKFSTNDHDGYADKVAAEGVIAQHREQLSNLQELLYASQAKSVLIILQGMDTAGKDGVISHIFSGINPQGCDVSSFKVPTPLELRHNFLWRCQAKVPPRGMIGIFNRSHYEDVLSPRVHGHISKKTVHERFNQIVDFEKSLYDNDTIILKFFLHLSREEQTERLQSRIDNPDKRWKLSPADFEERPFWPKYIDAYEDILSHTSQKCAPWFVIPSDHKWYRNVAISGILVEAMKGLKLKYPEATFDPSGIDLNKIGPRAAAKKVEARIFSTTRPRGPFFCRRHLL
jgi:PPK2 family polyphosphate:nucleotide phosphotransferase